MHDRRVASRSVRVAALTVALALGALGSARAATVGGFDYGEIQASRVGVSGCGTNPAGEPAIHVSRANNVFLGSENGLGGGSQLWRGLAAPGGTGAPGRRSGMRGR